MEYVINFTWDNESGVWIATSNDIPGLVLESGSFDALLERTRFAVPELLELNAATVQPLSLTFKSERHYLFSTAVFHIQKQQTCLPVKSKQVRK